jgi:hypothetical protein
LDFKPPGPIERRFIMGGPGSGRKKGSGELREAKAPKKVSVKNPRKKQRRLTDLTRRGGGRW